ncbi:MAG: hypothetical protein H6713_13515 [Myxococcales bacterium]|nr:hypothetical protein [Myxococcales bacterium]
MRPRVVFVLTLLLAVACGEEKKGFGAPCVEDSECERERCEPVEGYSVALARCTDECSFEEAYYGTDGEICDDAPLSTCLDSNRCESYCVVDGDCPMGALCHHTGDVLLGWDQGVCRPRCIKDQECAEALRCVDGLCLGD